MEVYPYTLITFVTSCLLPTATEPCHKIGVSYKIEFSPRGANPLYQELKLIMKGGKLENERVASPEVWYTSGEATMSFSSSAFIYDGRNSFCKSFICAKVHIHVQRHGQNCCVASSNFHR